MENGKNFVLGIYEDEEVLLKAVRKIREAGVRIHEVYSPFPVHGLENELGYKRSWMPKAGFLFGFLGLTLALIMQSYMLHFDWPMIIGGKNTISVTYVPVTFELTVLISALGMVGTFLIVADLKPWGRPKSLDLRCTDDKHVMAINLGKNKEISSENIKSLLKETGASEVNHKNH